MVQYGVFEVVKATNPSFCFFRLQNLMMLRAFRYLGAVNTRMPRK